MYFYYILFMGMEHRIKITQYLQCTYLNIFTKTMYSYKYIELINKRFIHFNKIFKS